LEKGKKKVSAIVVPTTIKAVSSRHDIGGGAQNVQVSQRTTQIVDPFVVHAERDDD
jgi:hypothetical protein